MAPLLPSACWISALHRCVRPRFHTGSKPCACTEVPASAAGNGSLIVMFGVVALATNVCRRLIGAFWKLASSVALVSDAK